MNPEIEKLLSALSENDKKAIMELVLKSKMKQAAEAGARKGAVRSISKKLGEGAKAGVRTMYENGGKIGGEPDVNELLDALSKNKQGKVARLENRDTRQYNREQNQQFRESLKVYNELYDAGPESWTPEQADFVNQMDSYLEEIYGNKAFNKSAEDGGSKLTGRDIGKALAGSLGLAGIGAVATQAFRKDVDNPYGTSIIDRLKERFGRD